MRKKKVAPKRKPRKWSEAKLKELKVICYKDYGDKIYNLIKTTSEKNVYESIGKIELGRNGHIDSSEIKQKYRGRGIGKYFYEQVLLHNGKLSSTPSSTSTQARRVHRSLMKKYKHKVDVYGDDNGNRWNSGDIIYYPVLLKPNKK